MSGDDDTTGPGPPRRHRPDPDAPTWRDDIDREEAIHLARRALADRGDDVGGHALTVEETDEEWRIVFEPPSPAPPGTERAVFVSKETGETRVLQGE